MQQQQTHPLEHALVDTLHHLIVHFFVQRVSPPAQDVGVLEDRVIQAVFRLREGGGADGGVVAEMFPERRSHDTMDAIGIDAGGLIKGLLAMKLIPDGDPDRLRHAKNSLAG